ncbi:MAG TPA: hypothetical protein VHV09_03735 [Trebonia sp.]|nr:hypothetical protein [Trebonia sp.]
MEIYTTNVTAARVGAACLGVGSPWANLAAVGAQHALARTAVPATGIAGARPGAFRPVPAPTTPQLALMSAELLPTVNGTRKQNDVHKTRINAGGYGAMGPHPEREQPA